MMTVTPPRSESSPDISPCSSSATCTPEKLLASKNAFPSPTADSRASSADLREKKDSRASAPVGFEIHSNSVFNSAVAANTATNASHGGVGGLGLDSSKDSHLHSLLHGRPLISFQKGPSPPQDSVLFNNDLLRRPSSASTASFAGGGSSYRNALAKGATLSDIQENGDQPLNAFSSGDSFAFDAASWSNALGNLGRMSAPSAGHAAPSGGATGKPYGHRNTMPSMPTSPFAFDQFSFNPQASNNQPAPSNASATSSLPYCGTSLTCYLVQFTSGRTDTYYIPHETSITVNVGDYVVVEADRGEDLGRVIMDNINVPLPRRNSTSGVMGFTAAPEPSHHNQFDLDDNSQAPANNMPKQIYRVAQPIEVESLLGKVRDELNAIAVGQYKVQEWKLPMVIIDAEYQWDRRKLTFFFSVTLPQYFPNQPSPRIDFRTLVRDLYQIYRTRIWMYCVDKDKNRSNRSHNREKFLKQLYKDTGKNQTAPIGTSTAGASSTTLSNNSSSNTNGGNGARSQQNSLKAMLEDHNDNWDVLEKINEAAIEVDDLSFAIGGMSVNR